MRLCSRQYGNKFRLDLAADGQVGQVCYGIAQPPVLGAAVVRHPGKRKRLCLALDRLDACRPPLVSREGGVLELGRRVVHGVNHQRTVDKGIGAGNVNRGQHQRTPAAASEAIELPVDIERHVAGCDLDPPVVEKRNVQKRVRSFHDAAARFPDPEFVVLAGRAAGKCQDLAVTVVVRKQDMSAGRRHRAH